MTCDEEGRTGHGCPPGRGLWLGCVLLGVAVGSRWTCECNGRRRRVSAGRTAAGDGGGRALHLGGGGDSSTARALERRGALRGAKGEAGLWLGLYRGRKGEELAAGAEKCHQWPGHRRLRFEFNGCLEGGNGRKLRREAAPLLRCVFKRGIDGGARGKAGKLAGGRRC
jgi:hypothetical protein